MTLVYYQVFFFGSIDSFGKDSLSKDLCREAIAWRSFTHRSILPLLGIFEEKSHLFLVSPFIENGTLIQWRKQQERDVVEIHRMVRPPCLSA